ncbi:MAG: elongation factor 1-alpha [Candidatus Micrarchaeota archaeon]|nr:MAG: elongation factor 1-alpha [Candidatus Micrarchaeota archaeon]
MAEKPHLNIIFIGHVDHGKSTTVGRVLYETGKIDDRALQKYKEEAQKYNKPTFEFAFVMDALKEERERGITIDIAHKDFETNKYHFTVIDAPGHRDFVKNMITGASQADAAVLVVSSVDGPMAQTQEHAILASVLGIKQIILGLNKVDAINYDKAKYEEVKNKVLNLLKTLGYKEAKDAKGNEPRIVAVVPYSALKGDNVKTKSSNTPWYDGPTLLEALDLLNIPPKPVDKPLRIPIQDVYSIQGFGTVPVGRVESGVLKPGDKIVIMPSKITTEVKSIEMHHQPLQKAEPGDNIGFNIKDVTRDQIKRGDVVGPSSNPPTVAESFTAQVVILQHPNVIAAGYTPVLHIHTAQVACKFEHILEKKDRQTGQTLEKDPQSIKTGDIAIVKMRPMKPVVVEKYTDFPALGRFAIRDMGMTIGAGIVIDVTPLSQ